ncbi:hypothetical protein [Streptomyces sp. NPDC003327]
MSAPHERTPLALHAYVGRLRAAAPEAPPPPGGHPLPDTARPPRTCGAVLPYREARAAVADLLIPLLAAPDPAAAAVEAERALAATGLREQIVFPAAAALAPPDATAARALGRALVRTGTTVQAVSAGLGLLVRHGEPEDVPYLSALGLLDGLARNVDAALAPLAPAAAALVRLNDRVRGEELRGLVEALYAGDRPAALARLLELPRGHRTVGPQIARGVAEATDLVGLLAGDHDPDGADPRLLATAVFLLGRMTSSREYRAEILAYADAVALYETVAARAHRLPRDVGQRARLLTLAQDLHSGASYLLDWPPGRRTALVRTLLDLVDGPGTAPADAAERRRADWVRRTVRGLREATRSRGPAGTTPRLRVEVAVADPGDPDVVETRFLIDGRPVVPEAFGAGPGDTPERVVDGGLLRAAPEAREVRLAEAYCTEGCCGALYVTIRREGPHVVWSDWKRPGGPAGPPGLPAYRFDAEAYDAEIARAEDDRTWTWPARTTARLIAAGLRDRPDLLTRWGLRRGWISTDFADPDTTVVTFTGPPLGGTGPDGPRPDGGAGPAGGAEPEATGPTGVAPEGIGPAGAEPESRQFLWRLPDDGTPPAARAAAALERLAAADPRSFPEPPPRPVPPSR